MSLRKISSQLQRRNQASAEQINRTFEPKMLENLYFRFSPKAVIFSLKPTGRFEEIFFSQYLAQLTSQIKEQMIGHTSHDNIPFLRISKIAAGYTKKIVESYAKALPPVLDRKNALFDNIVAEFITKRINGRTQPVIFDPSIKIISSYGKSNQVVEKFLTEFEEYFLKDKIKINPAEREQ